MEHHSWGHSYLRTYFRLLQGEDARLRSCEGESVKLRSRSSKSAKMQFLSIYSCNKKQHMGQTIKSRKSFEFFLVSCNKKEFRPHNINISLDFHSSKCQVSWIFMSVLKKWLWKKRFQIQYYYIKNNVKTNPDSLYKPH